MNELEYRLYDQNKEILKKEFLDFAIENIMSAASRSGWGHDASDEQLKKDKRNVPGQTHIVQLDPKSWLDQQIKSFVSQTPLPIFTKIKGGYLPDYDSKQLETLTKWIVDNIPNINSIFEGAYNYATQIIAEQKTNPNFSYGPLREDIRNNLMPEYKDQFRISKWKIKESSEHYFNSEDDKEHSEERAKEYGELAAIHNAPIQEYIDNAVVNEHPYSGDLLRNLYQAANWLEIQENFNEQATEWLNDSFFDEETKWIWEEGFEEHFWDGFYKETNHYLEKLKNNIIREINDELPYNLKEDYYVQLLHEIGYRDDKNLITLIEKINKGQALPESLFNDGDEWQQIITYISEIDENIGFPDYLTYLKNEAMKFSNNIINFMEFYPLPKINQNRKVNPEQLDFTNELDQRTAPLKIQSKWKIAKEASEHYFHNGEEHSEQEAKQDGESAAIYNFSIQDYIDHQKSNFNKRNGYSNELLESLYLAANWGQILERFDDRVTEYLYDDFFDEENNWINDEDFIDDFWEGFHEETGRQLEKIKKHTIKEIQIELNQELKNNFYVNILAELVEKEYVRSIVEQITQGTEDPEVLFYDDGYWQVVINFAQRIDPENGFPNVLDFLKKVALDIANKYEAYSGFYPQQYYPQDLDRRVNTDQLNFLDEFPLKFQSSKWKKIAADEEENIRPWQDVEWEISNQLNFAFDGRKYLNDFMGFYNWDEEPWNYVTPAGVYNDERDFIKFVNNLKDNYQVQEWAQEWARDHHDEFYDYFVNSAQYDFSYNSITDEEYSHYESEIDEMISEVARDDSYEWSEELDSRVYKEFENALVNEEEKVFEKFREEKIKQDRKLHPDQEMMDVFDVKEELPDIPPESPSPWVVELMRQQSKTVLSSIAKIQEKWKKVSADYEEEDYEEEPSIRPWSEIEWEINKGFNNIRGKDIAKSFMSSYDWPEAVWESILPKDIFAKEEHLLDFIELAQNTNPEKFAEEWYENHYEEIFNYVNESVRESYNYNIFSDEEYEYYDRVNNNLLDQQISEASWEYTYDVLSDVSTLIEKEFDKALIDVEEDLFNEYKDYLSKKDRRINPDQEMMDVFDVKGELPYIYESKAKLSSNEDWSEETDILIDHIIRDDRMLNPAIKTMEKIVRKGGTPQDLTNWIIENVLNPYNEQVAQQWGQISDEQDVEDQKRQLRRTWKQQARKQFPFSLQKQKQYVQEMEQMQFGLLGDPEPEQIEQYLLRVENIDWQGIYDWVKEDLQYRGKMASSSDDEENKYQKFKESEIIQDVFKKLYSDGVSWGNEEVKNIIRTQTGRKPYEWFQYDPNGRDNWPKPDRFYDENQLSIFREILNNGYRWGLKEKALRVSSIRFDEIIEPLLKLMKEKINRGKLVQEGAQYYIEGYQAAAKGIYKNQLELARKRKRDPENWRQSKWKVVSADQFDEGELDFILDDQSESLTNRDWRVEAQWEILKRDFKIKIFTDAFHLAKRELLKLNIDNRWLDVDAAISDFSSNRYLSPNQISLFNELIKNPPELKNNDLAWKIKDELNRFDHLYKVTEDKEWEELVNIAKNAWNAGWSYALHSNYTDFNERFYEDQNFIEDEFNKYIQKSSSHGQNQMAIGDEVAETTFEGVEVDPDPEPEEKIINGKKWKIVRPKPNKQPAEYARPKGGWGFYSKHKKSDLDDWTDSTKLYIEEIIEDLPNKLRMRAAEDANYTARAWVDRALKGLSLNEYYDPYYDSNTKTWRNDDGSEIELSSYEEKMIHFHNTEKSRLIHKDQTNLGLEQVRNMAEVAARKYDRFDQNLYWELGQLILDYFPEIGSTERNNIQKDINNIINRKELESIYNDAYHEAWEKAFNQEVFYEESLINKNSKKDAWEAVLDGEMGHDILTTGTWEEVKKQTIKWLKQLKDGYINKKNPHDNDKIDSDAKEQDSHALEDLKLYKEEKRWSFHFDHGKHPYDLIIQPVGYKESKWKVVSENMEDWEIQYVVKKLKSRLPNFMFGVGRNVGGYQLQEAMKRLDPSLDIRTLNRLIFQEDSSRSYNPNQLTIFNQYINSAEIQDRFWETLKFYIQDELYEIEKAYNYSIRKIEEVVDNIIHQLDIERYQEEFYNGFNLAFTNGPQNFYDIPKTSKNSSKNLFAKDKDRRLMQVGDYES